MALRSIVKRSDGIKSTESVVNLYRSIVQELPRVMAIYDVDMPVKQARKAINFHFQKHAALQDERVIGLLISKGYMELEETLKQWKQKTHLLRILDPIELTAGYPKAPEKAISEDKVPKELADAINDSDPIRFAKFFAACNEEDALKWMSVLCDSKREPVPVNIAEPEEEAETYSYFKTALSWDPSEEIIRKGQKPFQREAEPISIRSKYYYN